MIAGPTTLCNWPCGWLGDVGGDVVIPPNVGRDVVILPQVGGDVVIPP